jgi:hypothetical protein
MMTTPMTTKLILTTIIWCDIIKINDQNNIDINNISDDGNDFFIPEEQFFSQIKIIISCL